MNDTTLILASSSVYRRAQLDNLGLRFSQIGPDADEHLIDSEAPEDRAERLALLKAKNVSELAPLTTDTSINDKFIVVASDQVCHLEGAIYRKPGSMDRAEQHLATFSGQWVSFSTGIALMDANGHIESSVETFKIRFKHLSRGDIMRYLRIDQPLDCAGAIKVESLGITLLSDTDGRDINSLIGLPLMLLEDLLKRYNLSIYDFI